LDGLSLLRLRARSDSRATVQLRSIIVKLCFHGASGSRLQLPAPARTSAGVCGDPPRSSKSIDRLDDSELASPSFSVSWGPCVFGVRAAVALRNGCRRDL